MRRPEDAHAILVGPFDLICCFQRRPELWKVLWDAYLAHDLTVRVGLPRRPTIAVDRELGILARARRLPIQLRIVAA